MLNTNEDLIKTFKKLYVQLEQSKFIMAGDMITKILKFVTSNEQLFFIVKHSNQNFDFESVANETVIDDRIKMPDDDYKVIVFVTKILFDIDRNNVNFINFLKNAFPNSSLDDSFDDFCRCIVYPYVQAFERLMRQSDKVLVADKQVQIKNLPSQLVDSLQADINLIYAQVKEYGGVSAERKDEIFTILNGMSAGLQRNDLMLVKSHWIGLKYALQVNKVYTSQMTALESELKNYNVI